MLALDRCYTSQIIFFSTNFQVFYLDLDWPIQDLLEAIFLLENTLEINNQLIPGLGNVGNGVFRRFDIATQGLLNCFSWLCHARYAVN